MPGTHLIERKDFATEVSACGMQVCIAQLHRSVADIVEDQSSPANFETMRQLLEGNGEASLVDRVQLGRTILLQCPEYSFGSDDWARLDALVRNFPRKLILCVGFGLARSDAVDAITQSPDVVVGWSVPAPLPSGFRYNFGALWLHPGHRDSSRHEGEVSTRCYLFGKTISEQVNERNYNPYEFSEHLQVELADLTLLPFICADVISRQTTFSVSDAIQASIRRSTTPSIVLGLLRQCSAQDDTRWSGSISALANIKGNGQSTVVIANAASNHVALTLAARNLSGVYAAFGTRAAQGRAAPTIQGHYQGLEAWRLRTAESYLVLGTLQMGAHAVDRALHHFFPDYAWTIVQDGALRPEHRSAIGLELSAAGDVVLSGFDHSDVRARASELIAATLRKHEVSTPCWIDSVANAWLQGPLRPDTNAAEPLDSDDVRYISELRICLEALGGLMNVPTDGQGLLPRFVVPDQYDAAFNPATGTWMDVPVWLWVDLSRDRQVMLNELTRHLGQDLHRPGAMLVLGRGQSSDFLHRPLWKAPASARVAQPSFASADVRTDLSNVAPRPGTRMVRLMGIDSLRTLWTRNLGDPIARQAQLDELDAIRQELIRD